METQTYSLKFVLSFFCLSYFSGDIVICTTWINVIMYILADPVVTIHLLLNHFSVVPNPFWTQPKARNRYSRACLSGSKIYVLEDPLVPINPHFDQ